MENASESGPSSTTAPPSLFDACLIMVATNADVVESLRGFPEDIAKLLWERMLKIDKVSHWLKDCSFNITLFLKNPDGAHVAPFADAYPAGFLPGLRMSSLLMVNERLDEDLPVLLNAVEELDLGGCRLGDYHELV